MKTQNKKNIIYGGIAIAALIVLWLVFGSGGGNSSGAPDIYSASVLGAAERYFDFETVSMKNGNVTHDFHLTNEGTDPVVIKKVYTSCMCTVANITDASGKAYGPFGMPGHAPAATTIVVAPGESMVVTAVFDPAAHGPAGVGLAQRSIYLETNSQASPNIELQFQATVVR